MNFFYMNERMYIYEFFINNNNNNNKKRERELHKKIIIQLLRVIEVVCVFVVTAIVIFEAHIVSWFGLLVHLFVLFF